MILAVDREGNSILLDRVDGQIELTTPEIP